VSDCSGVTSFNRAHDVERENADDEVNSADSDVVDGLRAALDLERSTTQQLTESLQREQQHVTQLTAELSRLGEHLTAERSLSARLRNDVDSAVVS